MGIVIPAILSALAHIYRKLKERRDSARTRRFINNLPRSVQQDIGWSGNCEEWEPADWQLSRSAPKR